MQKNACARQACRTETAGGRRSRTVSPPSSPCATTLARASQASRRTPARFSRTANQSASPIVSSPTAAAISRCPCSNSTPPVMCGNRPPNDSGQSGTESPEPVLVTSPPATRRTVVAHAQATA